MSIPNDAELAHKLARLAPGSEHEATLEAASRRIRELSIANHVLRSEASEAADFLARRAADYRTLDSQAGKDGALQLELRVEPLRRAATLGKESAT